MKDQERISIIIPTKNEAGTIGEVLDETLTIAEDILVVDGHSTDGTPDIVRLRGVRLIFDEGRGKGSALKRGVAQTRGDIIVFADADGSHLISDIPRLVQPIRDGTADLVVASRMLGGSDELHGTFNKFIRNTGNNFLAVLVNMKWKTELSDIENGFRAIRREAFERIDLSSDGFTVEQEMVIRCLKHRLRVVEVASHEYARKSGYSKLKTIQGFRFLLHFFREYLF